MPKVRIKFVKGGDVQSYLCKTMQLVEGALTDSTGECSAGPSFCICPDGRREDSCEAQKAAEYIRRAVIKQLREEYFHKNITEFALNFAFPTK